MKFIYIENPKTNRQQVKWFVKEFIATGEWNKWVVLMTSKSNSEKELKGFGARIYGYRQRYENLQWDIHRGKNSFSIICRKEQI